MTGSDALAGAISGKYAFFTVGTTKFQELVDASCSHPVLEILSEMKLDLVVIQGGSSEMPRNIEFFGLNTRAQDDLNVQSGHHSGTGMRIVFFSYLKEHEFIEILGGSEIVVAHCGAGTIIHALRAHKPLVAIPNGSLMDDHQRQLGLAFSSRNLLHFVDEPNQLAELLRDTFIEGNVRALSLWEPKSLSVSRFLAGTSGDIAVVLGSGGHTTEMLNMLQNVDLEEEEERILQVYFAWSDDRSGEIIQEFIRDNMLGPRTRASLIPRLRYVGESWLWAPLMILRLLLAMSIVLLPLHSSGVLLINGPGVCFPVLLLAVFLNKLRLANIRIIFVESLCRVTNLSLTGRIVHKFGLYDTFLVQWEELTDLYIGTQYEGVAYASG